MADVERLFGSLGQRADLLGRQILREADAAENEPPAAFRVSQGDFRFGDPPFGV